MRGRIRRLPQRTTDEPRGHDDGVVIGRPIVVELDGREDVLPDLQPDAARLQLARVSARCRELRHAQLVGTKPVALEINAGLHRAGGGLDTGKHREATDHAHDAQESELDDLFCGEIGLKVLLFLFGDRGVI